MAHSNPAKAALFMAGAILSFSTMAVAGREIAVELNTFELMLYRSIVGLAVVCCLLGFRGRFAEIRTGKIGLHLLRNLFHFAGQNLWFYGVAVIPLAQIIALEFTAPIWVALTAPLVLGERLTRARTLSALLGFIGILIVVRPGMIELGYGHLAGFCAALGFAGSILVTKRLSDTDTAMCILFWMTAMQTVMGILIAVPLGLSLPSAQLAPWVVLVGFAGLSAHFCLTSALANAPATIVSPMDFLRLPFIAVVGMLLYGEPLEIAVFAGGLLILIGNLVNIRAERRRNAVLPAAV